MIDIDRYASESNIARIKHVHKKMLIYFANTQKNVDETRHAQNLSLCCPCEKQTNGTGQ